MILFRPKWMSKKQASALACVYKLQDEDKLCLAATRSPHEAVRLAAARKLKTDDAILRVIREMKLSGSKKELLVKETVVKEMMEKLQDKERLNTFLDAPDLVVKYYALKYAGSEDEAFELLKKASDQGEAINIESYVDDLSAEQCYSILSSTRCQLYGTKFDEILFDQMKKSLPDKESFEDMLCDLAIHAENQTIRYCSARELTMPHIIQRYQNAIKAIQLREHAKAEEEKRIAREKEEEKKRKKIQTDKERFFQGEELFWMDEAEVLKSLTTDEIKAYGLTVPFFEKLYDYYDLESFRDKVLIPCTDQTILRYLIRCLDDRNKHNRQKIGDKASTAARLLAFLYRGGRFTDEIKMQTGKVLQSAGEMPQFNMNDPLERDMAQGYYPEPEIRFDPKEYDGKKYEYKAQIRREELPKHQDITRVSALRESGLKARSSLEIDRCARELNNIAKRGGSTGHRANLALRDIVLGNHYTGWDTPKIAGYITEKEIASDPAVLRQLKMVEEYSGKFDDAMTAQDSGVGRSV